MKLDDNIARLRSELEKCRMRQRELEDELIRQRDDFEREKLITNTLLNRIYPEVITSELLSKGTVKVRFYNDVTVLFADIENFSVRSAAFTPVELVELLDRYFNEFDNVVRSHGLEKIKTIGDCYMCAGGLPVQDSTNPYRAVMAGLILQQVVADFSENLSTKGRVPFEFRIGIHTGQAVAGMVGKWKPAYDIWGRAANIGSLMVQAGEIKRVNISRSTYEMVSDSFQCVFRGSIPTKGGTAMRMYFVERLKPSFSEDEKGMVPNRRFLRRVGLNL